MIGWKQLDVLRVSTDNATNIGTDSATLHGSLSYYDGEHFPVSVYFEYRKADGSGSSHTTSTQTLEQGTDSPYSFSIRAYGLEAGTGYDFRAVALGDNEDPYAFLTGEYIGNYYYGNYLHFVTSEAPVNVDSTGAEDITDVSATLTGEVLSLGGNSTVQVRFSYGAHPYVNTYNTSWQTVSSLVDFSAGITGLIKGTQYLYRAEITDGSSTAYGDTLPFTADAPPVTVTTNLATDVAEVAGSPVTVSAKLNATLNSLDENSSLQVYFEYGLDTSYDDTTVPQTKTSTGSFSANLAGLDNAEYHFRGVATDGSNYWYGGDKTFKTTPEITTLSATSITDISATLNGRVDALGANNSLSVYFEWGTTDSYGNSTTQETVDALSSFSAGITGLTDEQEYHFRAVATDGINYWYGEDGSFTADVTPVSVDTDEVSNATFTTVTLNGTLNGMGYESSLEVFFEVGKTIAYNTKTESQTLVAAGSFSQIVDSLEDDTTYHIRAVATNGTTTWVGDDVEFTTDKRYYIEITTDPDKIHGDFVGFPLYVDLADLASDDHILHRDAANNLYSDSNPNDFSNGTLLDTEEVTSGLVLLDMSNVIQTDNASDQTENSVTLNGELLSMEGEASIDVYFEYGGRYSDGSPYPTKTSVQTLSGTGTFNQSITIGMGTSLTYRAVATDAVSIWYGSDQNVNPLYTEQVELGAGSIESGSLRTIIHEKDTTVVEIQVGKGSIISGSLRTIYYNKDMDIVEITLGKGEITGGSKI